MAAPKQNLFWKKRMLSGRKPIFNTPEELEKAVMAVFKNHAANPILKQCHAIYQGKAFPYWEERPRVVTLGSLCLHLGISRNAWRNWREERNDLKEVIDWAETCVWVHKLELAAAHVVNANIISQEMGLKTKIDHTVSSESLEDFLDNLESDEPDNEQESSTRKTDIPEKKSNSATTSIEDFEQIRPPRTGLRKRF